MSHSYKGYFEKVKISVATVTHGCNVILINGVMFTLKKIDFLSSLKQKANIISHS